MLITDFDFELPDSLIAQEPLADRQASRMLAVDRGGSFTDDAFVNFPKKLRKGDVLVVNNTKVFPARLYGHTTTGANVEIFLVSERADGTWETLARPARRLSAGKRIVFDTDVSAEVVERSDDGRVIVRFETAGPVMDAIERIGITPLPPYIKREPGAIDADRERYQTVFASDRGAIAAPTAGLHFTEEILAEIDSLGVERCEITLHVGYGTFEPVRVNDLSEHRVSAERYSIGDGACETLTSALRDGRRIVAVGTTTTRALESELAASDSFKPGARVAELTITPGYRFRAVGALLTNFHLPKSSLLVLTSTFGGHEIIMSAYRHAVDRGYRYYSYGDCMFIY